MNLINQFTHTLGYYCSVNQLVELSLRFFTAKAAKQLVDNESFAKLAHDNKITLTSYEPAKAIPQISLSYIVHIHLCFENYLKDICRHAKKYGRDNVKEKEQDESWLAYAVSITNNSTSDIVPLIELCEYYRLVRNSAVHDVNGEMIKNTTAAFEKIKKHTYHKEAKFTRLEAPNSYNCIGFDDFVMFARSCNRVANYLYENSSIDYEKIVSSMDSNSLRKFTRYQNNRKRGENAVKQYMITHFKYDVTRDTELPELFNLILARSSNR